MIKYVVAIVAVAAAVVGIAVGISAYTADIPTAEDLEHWEDWYHT